MTNKDDFNTDSENDENTSSPSDTPVRNHAHLTNTNQRAINDISELENPLNVAKTQIMSESLAKAISQSIQDNEENEENEEPINKNRKNGGKQHKIGCLFFIVIILVIVASIAWCIQNQDKLDPKISKIIKEGEKIVLAGKNFINNKSSLEESEKDFEEDLYENSDVLDSDDLSLLDNNEEEKTTSPDNEKIIDKNNSKGQDNSDEITELEEIIEIENDDILQKDEDAIQKVPTIKEEVEEIENNYEKDIKADNNADINENNNESAGEEDDNPLSLELSLLAQQLNDIENGKFTDIVFDNKADFQEENFDTSSQKQNTSEKVIKTTQDKEEVDLDTLGLKIKALIIKFGKPDNKANLLATLIQSQCKQHDLPVPLMTSIIAEGSSFKEDYESSNGRIGLMQISKNELSEFIKLSKDTINKEDLKNPTYNLKVGLWYMNYLKSQLNNDLKKATIAKLIGINEFKKFEESNLPFPKKLQQRLGQIGIIYNLLTKNLVINSKTNVANKNNDKDGIVDKKSTENEENISKPETIEETTSTEPSDQTEKEPTKKVKKLNYKLAVKNILSAKNLPSILKWTVVPDDEISDITQIVTSIAKKYNFDPLFIAAIIMSESSFNSEIVSESGKIGLLQINPEKAPEIAKVLGIEWLGAEALKDPEYNLKLGVGFLNYCLQNHKNDFNGGMYAYNQGDDTKELDENTQILFNKYLDNIKFYLKSWGGHLPK